MSAPCPGCTAPMKPFLAGKVELDRCPFCRGLFFDGGELEQVLNKRLVGSITGDVDNTRKCARDGKPMQAAELGGLRVEVCLQCRAVFLDDGELVKLNGGQQVRVQELKKAPAVTRTEAESRDDVMGWLDSLGV
jgi:Zn-finger nucleic acid-binding protein